MIEQYSAHSSNRKPHEERECRHLWYMQHVQNRAQDNSTGVTENHRQEASVQHVPRDFLLHRDGLQPGGGLPPEGGGLHQPQRGLLLQRGSPLERAAHLGNTDRRWMRTIWRPGYECWISILWCRCSYFGSSSGTVVDICLSRSK